MKRIRAITRRSVCYIILISFIITFNIFFGLFVWNTYDLAPNQAMGFISILMILLISYNWKKDEREEKDILLNNSNIELEKNQKV